MALNNSIRRLFYLLLVFFLLLSFSCAPRLKYSTYGKDLYQNVETGKLPWQVCATSVNGRNIRLLELGSGKQCTLIFGAFHGSEPMSAEMTIRFAEYLYFEYQRKLDSKIVIVPIVNPDGLYFGIRTNAHGVDLNRNFPTKNWTENYIKRSTFPGKFPASEPETQVVVALIERYQPDRIISIHTPLRVVNYDGPARELAIRMSLSCGYPVTDDIGYATPGSLGNYAGVERNIPTITLELPRGLFEKIWEENREALLLSIFYE